MTNNITPPLLKHTFSEAMRTTVEFWNLRSSYHVLKEKTLGGNGQPVLVLPGLGTTDFSTSALRDFLAEKGHHVHGWDGGLNTGPDERILQHLPARLQAISGHHGGAPVALVGHSLGGIYGRELARAFPDKVSQVITLGTPFSGGLHPDATAPVVRRVFEAINGKNHHLLNDATLARLMMQPPPVPTTSVYSCSDGLVSWRACLNPKHAKAENVEVTGSHCGLVVNTLAFVVIADRLGQAGDWKPFSHAAYSSCFAFPSQSHRGQEPDLNPPPSGKGGMFGRVPD